MPLESMDTEGRFTQRQRELLRSLKALAAERAASETELLDRYERRGAEAEQEYNAAKESAARAFREATTKAEEAHRRRQRETRAAAREEHRRTKLAAELDESNIREKAETNEREAQKQWEEAKWVAETVYEASEDQPEEQYRQRERIVDLHREELDTIGEQALVFMRKYRQPIPPEDEGQPNEPTLSALEQSSEIARTQLVALGRLRSARMFRGYLLPFQILLLVLAAAAVAFWLREFTLTRWVPIAAGATFVLLLGLSAVLYAMARRRSAELYREIRAAIAVARAGCEAEMQRAARDREKLAALLIAERDRDLRAADAKYEPILAEIRQRRDHHLARITETYPQRLAEIIARGEADLEVAEEAHRAELENLRRRFEAASREADERYTTTMEQRESAHEQEWSTLKHGWLEGMDRCGRCIAAITEEDRRLFRAWDDPAWPSWSPPHTFAPSVRFGTLHVDRERIPGGIAISDELRVDVPTSFDLPATLDFPDQCSLLMLADGTGRGAAVQTLQTVMMRLLTTLPPGKVRFTIIDPVSLGQNFAGFMHLADYDESFVSARIWTETRHIEQRLADLTEHMETVIQKYLRNEFETIAEYNEEAGEIAEPYRFLVISDFPVNFSETAARRLASVIASGARCGVYTLMTADVRQALPPGLDLEDVERHSTTIVHRDGKLFWKDDDFEDLELTLDPPPPEAFVTSTLQRVGEAAKDATRVEVPFEVVAPNKGECWSRSCAAELAVPLGRCGATKLQQLVIGPGTSQHGLIAGKTGSGKSTLLHVMITNLALWYSPDEVQLYLVDFKKGVEFKTYGVHDLPHARAVAVESDREFGLSVLQRVDAELKERGDRFRELGVQDLAGFRRTRPDEPMPRTLLIIDEFQELFVEDDKLGQDAALLMDRLVRQGRAFGIHVLLGSQTLGGAYTLARSTMGQMQIRIALQCTEADSYLIMSDDNAAARLLSRPGEGIYNDAGGRIEGNSPFQIVWLPEKTRERALQRVQELAREHGYERSEPLIVFEGNVPAEVGRNHLLASAIDAPSWTVNGAQPAPSAPQAWLGEAIAIKGPTAASLRRQSGTNLLMVGQRDEAALAMTTTAILSLAAQVPPGPDGARFFVLDGTPADAPYAGYLERSVAGLPHDVRRVPWRDVPDAIAEIAAELERRRASDAADAPTLCLVIFGLQRFRMLRTSDDFGFSMGDPDAPPAPEKQFAEILRDGPPLGIHTITWCDTATNLNRTLDRNGLREFEMRVLFQMSGADSTQLIDSPAAAKLGLKRALFFSEEQGVLEKFRPYALPEKAWLADVTARLAAKQPV